MNKLKEKIREATSVSRASLGFGSATRKKGATLLLLARGDVSELGAIGASIDGHIGSLGKRPADLSKESATGAATAPGEAAAIEKAAGDGYDFVLIGEDTPASALLSEELAYLMPAPANVADLLLLPSLALMPIDGLVVEVKNSLTVREQMRLAGFSAFTRKPIFAAVSSAPPRPDLEILRDAGVVGLILDVGREAGEFTSLRGAIDTLPPRRRRRDEREQPAVSLAATASTVVEDEEFDDE
jgi:hypothetical protein